MGSELKTEPNWPAGAVMAEGLRLLSLQKGLAEGTQYDAKVWVGAMMMAIDVHVVVGPRREVDVLGTSVLLTEVKTTQSDPGVGQVVTTSYVDDQQVPYRTLTSMAGIPIEMIRCTREFAMGRWDPVELISNMLLPSPVALGDVSKVVSITYLLRPKDAGLVDPALLRHTDRAQGRGREDRGHGQTHPAACGRGLPLQGQ